MVTVAERQADRELGPAEELRAQYVACSYLASACQEALGKVPPSAADDMVSQRALEFILAVEWDWRQTLQQLALRVAKASNADAGYNPTHAADTGAAGEGTARHRGTYRRRPSVRRRV